MPPSPASPPPSPAPPRPVVPPVVLVTTTGTGSMDGYGRALAARLPVRRVELAKEHTSSGDFGLPWLHRDAARQLAGDARAVRDVRRALAGARRERADGAALAHLPHHHTARYGPLLGVPYVLTVHDLIRWYDAHPARSPSPAPYISRPTGRDRFWLRCDYAAVAGAAAVIAVSETTRRDLLRHLGLPPQRVRVVYEGIDHELFRPVERRLVDPPYLLFVGAEHPRKNLATLLRAVAELKRDRRLADLRLVKVGAAGTAEAPFRAATRAQLDALGLALGRDVVLLDEHVPDADLPAYYSGAAALVLPSHYEGFGFPPLEAMACGCPAVVSTAGSLPEVTGGAALTAAPADVAGLVAALRRVLLEPGVAGRLRARGLARAREFSWERAARETAQVYDEVLSGVAGRAAGRKAALSRKRSRGMTEPSSPRSEDLHKLTVEDDFAGDEDAGMVTTGAALPGPGDAPAGGGDALPGAVDPLPGPGDDTSEDPPPSVTAPSVTAPGIGGPLDTAGGEVSGGPVDDPR